MIGCHHVPYSSGAVRSTEWGWEHCVGEMIRAIDSVQEVGPDVIG